MGLRRAVHAAEATRDRPRDLTVAIGYDGRAEVMDAVRSVVEAEAERGTSIEDLAGRIRPDDITAHLYVPELADPDMVIAPAANVAQAAS